MAKKKRGKKGSKSKTSKKKMNAVRSNKRKIMTVSRGLVFFAALSVLSYLLYNVSGQILFQNLFSLLSMTFGFISLGFLIVLLTLLLMKAMKK